MICFFESVLLKEGERTLEKLTAFITSGGFVGSLVVIALTALIIMLLKKLKKSYISRDGVDGKRETNARFIFSIARYVVFLIAFITVLQINGVNVSALVTGLGIVGIVVGFALQDVLKDFVMGNNIMLDHFFVVGRRCQIRKCHRKDCFLQHKGHPYSRHRHGKFFDGQQPKYFRNDGAFKLAGHKYPRSL